ncbi:MAG: ferrous iron transport protein A [Candidatus Zixiibacteriota bacterium]|nr:MAG: ferrous iron transport protein A [candidate division Zixibacteria bacterium]
MLYLSEAVEGNVYVMLGVGGGQRLRQKLYSMGLNPGVKFRVITNNGRGPVGVEVRDTRLAIGRGMAQRVKIRENGS